ncbi:hypothetical protein ABPG72_011845 [Tetrahymena utriculariae]
MGCIQTKKKLIQVQSINENNNQNFTQKNEKVYDFGLKKQDSLKLYDAYNPRGLITKHIQKKSAQKTLSNQNSQNFIELEEGYPTPSKVSITTINGKRASILTSQLLSTPQIEKIIQTNHRQ